MKKGIHPENYRPVVFKDMSNEDVFITRSTINAKETIEIDGVTYPLVKVEISNTSHPFYTGKSKLVDTAGRVDNKVQLTIQNEFIKKAANRLVAFFILSKIIFTFASMIEKSTTTTCFQ